METLGDILQQLSLAQGPHTLPKHELLQDHERIRNLLSSQKARHAFAHTFSDHTPHSSKAPLDSLKRITISKLTADTVHYGRVLVCRTIAKPLKFVGVQTIIEDPIVGQGSSGMEVAAARLSLYNFANFTGPHSDLNDHLPIGTRLFIKEPYYKPGSQDAVLMIRCDSPDDIILVPNEQVGGKLLAGLRWSDALPIKYGLPIKRGLKPQFESVDGLKQKGNEQFARKDYASAIDSYTCALELDPNNAVLLSNRAQAHLNLDQFRQALEDAEGAVKIDGTNSKALFRQAKALYGLRLYEEVSSVLKKLDMASADTEKLNQHTLQRLEEQQHGRYDLNNIFQEARSKQPPILDHADYVGPVRITKIAGKGRGMVATEDIVEGTLLLCSKAFAIVFPSEFPADARQNVINQQQSLSHFYIVKRIGERLQREPWTATEFYNLSAGHSIPPMSNTLQIDSDRIAKIVDTNSFTPKTYDTSSSSPMFPSNPPSTESSSESDDSKGLGLWILASYFNHSCLANARYQNMGDFIFVRSTRDITKGEEICVSYVLPFDEYDKREKTFNDREFRCQCQLCEFERAQPEATRHRASLLDQFYEMHNAIAKNDHSIIPRLMKIIDELRKTYETAASTGINASTSVSANAAKRKGGKKNKKKTIAAASSSSTTPTFVLPPRQLQLGMFPPISVLFHLYRSCAQLQQAVKTMVEGYELLPQCGNFVHIRAETAVAICMAYQQLRSSEEEARWMEIAKKEYELLYGVSKNWWDNMRKI
ncbi:hypothetical protein BC937DRAFT_95280 [Endogone sp. FLAS-F59071]|nr:hypothetical protein BC937DRAFT_95280 [Endogone sp. FLAS-F59071]|eukprot:RUS13460.1 hypothetical protein BC937DRAFT_95280 [Endogone sp. FLAS-F59071]